MFGLLPARASFFWRGKKELASTFCCGLSKLESLLLFLVFGVLWADDLRCRCSRPSQQSVLRGRDFARGQARWDGRSLGALSLRRRSSGATPGASRFYFEVVRPEVRSARAVAVHRKAGAPAVRMGYIPGPVYHWRHPLATSRTRMHVRPTRRRGWSLRTHAVAPRVSRRPGPPRRLDARLNSYDADIYAVRGNAHNET